jgi:hypothetical protein
LLWNLSFQIVDRYRVTQVSAEPFSERLVESIQNSAI